MFAIISYLRSFIITNTWFNLIHNTFIIKIWKYKTIDQVWKSSFWHYIDVDNRVTSRYIVWNMWLQSCRRRTGETVNRKYDVIYGRPDRNMWGHLCVEWILCTCTYCIRSKRLNRYMMYQVIDTVNYSKTTIITVYRPTNN